MAEIKHWFFVYIIESPSEVDLYHNRSEGELLQQAIGLNNIPCVSKVAISKNAFEACFQVGLLESMNNFKNLIPVIHISAHGFSEGIQLSNHETITWDQLRMLLMPINQSVGNCLLLCMSSCKGYSACRMAMSLNDNQHPFFSMVGHVGTPVWAETAVAFTTLYHLLAKGLHVNDAVEAMKISSGNYGFVFTTATESQQTYIDYCRITSTSDMQQRLRQQLPSDSLQPLSKRVLS